MEINQIQMQTKTQKQEKIHLSRWTFNMEEEILRTIGRQKLKTILVKMKEKGRGPCVMIPLRNDFPSKAYEQPFVYDKAKQWEALGAHLVFMMEEPIKSLSEYERLIQADIFREILKQEFEIENPALFFEKDWQMAWESNHEELIERLGVDLILDCISQEEIYRLYRGRESEPVILLMKAKEEETNMRHVKIDMKDYAMTIADLVNKAGLTDTVEEAIQKVKEKKIRLNERLILNHQYTTFKQDDIVTVEEWKKIKVTLINI